MIYFKEALNLAPASPETRDQLVALANSDMLPTYDRLGAHLWKGALGQEPYSPADERSKAFFNSD